MGSSGEIVQGHQGSVTDCSSFVVLKDKYSNYHGVIPYEPRPCTHIWWHYHKLNWTNFHNIIGLLFILVTGAEVFHFANTGQSSTQLRITNLVLALLLYVGVYRSELHTGDAPLGVMISRLGAWNVAYIALSNSIYTSSGEDWLNGEVPLLNVMGTGLFFLSIVDSLMILFSEIHSRNFVMQGFVVENVVTYTYLLGMPILHAILGSDALTEFYIAFPIGDIIYILAVLNAFIDSIDSFHICQVSANKLEKNTFHTISTVMWALIHSPGSAYFVGMLMGLEAGAYYYAMSFVIFLFGTLLEHVFERFGLLRYKTLEEVRLIRHFQWTLRMQKRKAD
mmetsp:Transcript_6047/g.9246  ORF Transcript_6047/g.9246 Transcript_6047/m.9246 type:complete len:336 (+) Transcript_6047:225-1232(+)|eukprot:CAMPEP_0178899456 /NCGR_PEP_ID=MMETSP0786-20121207/2913_1 /TAXON_ID=186022 /ORGANISM="Thalassionema frauenfeldii, Strain CCMP 1798" /LENGTH=335 /DNA_ID=CAMNT_0020570321 /DNA_START=139 /DNA_END=1146 /DNA_ORIENTATION=+